MPPVALARRYSSHNHSILTIAQDTQFYALFRLPINDRQRAGIT